MARLEEVTIDTQGWKERRCEDSSKTGSVEEGRGKGKGSEEEERRRFKERRYETCFPTHLDRGLVSRPVSTGPITGPSLFPSFKQLLSPNGRQQPPVIELANYHHPCHWSCGPGLTISATITTPNLAVTTLKTACAFFLERAYLTLCSALHLSIHPTKHPNIVK
jgi:hypothetical protein